MVDRAVVDTDRFVQQLMGVQEELGLAEQTNLVVTSDHGQMEVQRIMNLNVMLADYGFLDVRKDGYVTDWRAYCLSNGLSAVVYLKDPLDEKAVSESISAAALDERGRNLWNQRGSYRRGGR